jgi:predicted anti-sigma-YlaC factor YlaD
MDCDTHRELLSAGLDGETTALEQEAADTHLASCAACTTWFAAAVSVTRSARVGPADPVPDLTAAILSGSPVVDVPDPLPVVRLGLGFVAAAQVLVGQNGLFDVSHVAREQAVFELALAIGFATAAWRPRRAAGLVPLVGALVVGLLVTASIDAAGGTVAMLGEGHHVVAIIGLVLLVASTRLSATPRRMVPA